MEIGSSSVQLNVNEVDVNGQKLNPNNKCGVRAVRKRIYDPENGTTCHQVDFLSFYDFFCFFLYFILFFDLIFIQI
jgi:hypothetical protein